MYTLPNNFSVGNAAGTAKTLEEVRTLARTGIDIITVGSVTFQARQGNGPGSVHYRSPDGASVNVLGMPNRGMDFYTKALREMVEIAHKVGKKLAVSIAPIERGDPELLVALCIKARVDIIELNGGCPNVYAGGAQKRILSFDLYSLEEAVSIMIQYKSVHKWTGELRVKLSPYSDFVLLQEVAQLISGLGEDRCHVSVVTSNTFPNGFLYQWQNNKLSPALTYGEGYGGLSGEGFRGFALGQVRQFRKHLSDSHSIIGVGGISIGRDILEFLDSGATEVQVGSLLYYATNPALAANNLLEELSAYL